MATQKKPIVLFVATFLALGLLSFHFATRGASRSFDWDGVEWRVPDDGCLNYDQARSKVPSGFEIPKDDELQDLSHFLHSVRGESLRVRIPLLFGKDVAFWSSHALSLPDRLFVVSLSDAQANSQVPDLCAHVLIRKSTR